MSAPSDVYAALQLAAGGALSTRAWPFMELNRGNGLGCCVVGQQLHRPSESTSTNCSYMAWPKNEITEVFGGEVVELLSAEEIM